ncbi:hypothetical protein LCGC14_2134520 [marine sediment metagenome]|uniref:Uncharacterized protein n=1 Tax=marine sediment metagenome TaxID=412755 RepID=A0A0F9EMK1_9ZZZZ
MLHLWITAAYGTLGEYGRPSGIPTSEDIVATETVELKGTQSLNVWLHLSALDEIGPEEIKQILGDNFTPDQSAALARGLRRLRQAHAENLGAEIEQIGWIVGGE